MDHSEPRIEDETDVIKSTSKETMDAIFHDMCKILEERRRGPKIGFFFVFFCFFLHQEIIRRHSAMGIA